MSNINTRINMKTYLWVMRIWFLILASSCWAAGGFSWSAGDFSTIDGPKDHPTSSKSLTVTVIDKTHLKIELYVGTEGCVGDLTHTIELSPIRPGTISGSLPGPFKALAVSFSS